MFLGRCARSVVVPHYTRNVPVLNKESPVKFGPLLQIELLSDKSIAVSANAG
jgi:hypothetical protein